MYIISVNLVPVPPVCFPDLYHNYRLVCDVFVTEWDHQQILIDRTEINIPIISSSSL